MICAEVSSLSPFVVATEIPAFHDTAIPPLGVVKVKIADGATTVTKKLKVKVRNADLNETAGHQVQLAVTNSTCPASLLLDAMNQPIVVDFDPKSPTVGDTVTVPGGKTKSAVVPLLIVAADYLSPNAVSPARCSLTFVATSLDSLPVAEVNPSNNQVTVTIDVIDKNDF